MFTAQNILFPFRILRFFVSVPVCHMGGGGGYDAPSAPEPLPVPAPAPTPAPAPSVETDKDVREAEADVAKKEARRKGRKQTLLAGELEDSANTEKKKLLG